MTRNEHEYYVDISNIAKSLDRIANALENNNEVAHNVKLLSLFLIYFIFLYYTVIYERYFASPNKIAIIFFSFYVDLFGVAKEDSYIMG